MRVSRFLPLFLILAAAPATAQSEPAAPSNAADSADKFTLDLPPVDPDTAVTSAPAAPAGDPAPAGVVHRFTIDTPIAQLIENRRAKAVLDRNLPGMSTDKNLPKFRLLTLRKLQPASDGRLTDELLAKTDAELAEIQ